MADDDPFVNALARSYDGDPSTADVMAQYRAPQWGGLKSYMPDQPDWMKTAQGYAGRALGAVPPEAQLILNLLGRTPARGAMSAAPAPQQRSVGTMTEHRPLFRPPARTDVDIPIGAATKYGDEIVRTPVHGMEWDDMVAKLGQPKLYDMMNKGHIVEGFVTKGGEFLTRPQAAERARMADPSYGPSQAGMESNEMRPFDVIPSITAHNYLKAEGGYPAAINRLEAGSINAPPDTKARFREGAETLRQWRDMGPEAVEAAMRAAGLIK